MASNSRDPETSTFSNDATSKDSLILAIVPYSLPLVAVETNITRDKPLHKLEFYEINRPFKGAEDADYVTKPLRPRKYNCETKYL
jgi:hypothetical protein